MFEHMIKEEKKMPEKLTKTENAKGTRSGKSLLKQSRRYASEGPSESPAKPEEKTRSEELVEKYQYHLFFLFLFFLATPTWGWLLNLSNPIQVLLICMAYPTFVVLLCHKTFLNDIPWIIWRFFQPDGA